MPLLSRETRDQVQDNDMDEAGGTNAQDTYNLPMQRSIHEVRRQGSDADLAAISSWRNTNAHIWSAHQQRCTPRVSMTAKVLGCNKALMQWKHPVMSTIWVSRQIYTSASILSIPTLTSCRLTPPQFSAKMFMLEQAFYMTILTAQDRLPALMSQACSQASWFMTGNIRCLQKRLHLSSYGAEIHGGRLHRQSNQCPCLILSMLLDSPLLASGQ